jgi:hypothetical protein
MRPLPYANDQIIDAVMARSLHADVREYRDAFLSLAKTCAKHAIAFGDYLGSRLNVAGQALIPYLPDLIRCRGQPV